MRKTISIKLLLSAFLCFALAATESCKDDDTVDPKSQRINELSTSWIPGTVTNDDNDVTSLYSDFVLTINSDMTYETTDGGNAWPASGSFELGDDLDTIIRDDDVIIDILEVSEEVLILSFNMSMVNGRTDGVTGDFVFELENEN